MPRTIELPARPELTFGVFNRYGSEARPQEGAWAALQMSAGWKIVPHYGYSGGNVAHTDRAAAERLLSGALTAWERRVLGVKRQAITMQEVLVDRFIQRVVRANYGWYFYFMDDTSVRLTRTRGWRDVELEGPTEGPFLIRRILATYRTFRLDDGRSLVFDTKMELDRGSIPKLILDQTFDP